MHNLLSTRKYSYGNKITTYVVVVSVFLIFLFVFRPMLEYILDESPEVRQASAYGIGVMAQFAGQAYRDAIIGKI